MLVLTRRKSESLIINHNITVCVLDVKGFQVKMGIEAPSDVSVHRSEIEEKEINHPFKASISNAYKVKCYEEFLKKLIPIGYAEPEIEALIQELEENLSNFSKF